MRKLLSLAVFVAVMGYAAFGDVTVTVYQGLCPFAGASGCPAGTNSQDASNANNYASTLPNATFNSTGINFQTGATPGTGNSDVYPLLTFLNNPTFTSTNNGFNAAGMTDNIELVITGTIGLNSGNNSFVLGHDDGAVLSIPGFGSTCTAGATPIPNAVLCQPQPTAFTNTPFNVFNPGAANNFNFTLYYNECCDGPADLLFQVNNVTVGSNTPEPTSMLLLGTGLPLAIWRFRRRK